MHSRTLALGTEERAALTRTRDRDPRPYLRERAAAILKIADGMAPFAVARQGLATPRKPDTIYQWLARYEQHGLAGLLQHPRRPRGFPPSAGGRGASDAAPTSGTLRDPAVPLAAR